MTVSKAASEWRESFMWTSSSVADLATRQRLGSNGWSSPVWGIRRLRSRTSLDRGTRSGLLPSRDATIQELRRRTPFRLFFSSREVEIQDLAELGVKCGVIGPNAANLPHIEAAFRYDASNQPDST